MGKVAQEMAPDHKSVLPELIRAYANEWFGHYNYYFVSRMVNGPSAESIGAFLLKKSKVALDRADRLASRIIELGGTPVPKLTELVDAATDKPFKLAEDLSDVTALLEAVLDAERTSMRTHAAIYAMARNSDPLTAALALDLLKEAAQGEQQLERLLNDSGPDKTGT
jgi:bacterioferritin